MTKKYAEWHPEWVDEDLDLADAMAVDLDRTLTVMQALRDAMNLSQKDVSNLLATTQSNVSKIESKGDPKLSILRRIVEGSGGRLHVVAEFEDGRKLRVV